MDVKKIGIASDHAGYGLKAHVKEWLEGKGYTVVDYGTDSEASVDYPIFAKRLAHGIQSGEVSLGVGMCGSGNGISISLNRHRGVRAALAWRPELASLGREHNDANVLTMPARSISEEDADEIVSAFLSSTFEGGRHQRRVDAIELE